MQEMKIVILRVLQNLSLKLPENQPPIQVISEVVLKPKHGIKLVVSERI